jgi:hypothetical protein
MSRERPAKIHYKQSLSQDKPGLPAILPVLRLYLFAYANFQDRTATQQGISMQKSLRREFRFRDQSLIHRGSDLLETTSININDVLYR